MNSRTKLKLAMWYLKYQKYIWPAVVVAIIVVVVYFVWLR